MFTANWKTIASVVDPTDGPKTHIGVAGSIWPMAQGSFKGSRAFLCQGPSNMYITTIPAEQFKPLYDSICKEKKGSRNKGGLKGFCDVMCSKVKK